MREDPEQEVVVETMEQDNKPDSDSSIEQPRREPFTVYVDESQRIESEPKKYPGRSTKGIPAIRYGFDT